MFQKKTSPRPLANLISRTLSAILGSEDRVSPGGKRAKEVRPTLTTLENRECPAVIATVSNAGALTFRIDNNSSTGQHVALHVNSSGHLVYHDWYNSYPGMMGVRLRYANGQPVVPSTVTSITIRGSDLNNWIDLRAVNRAHFRNLDGKVTVFAGDGRDEVFGSEFRNTIDGGNGDDSIVGGASADVLRGGSGIDWMWGVYGNDVMEGGHGNDRLYGGHGNDVLLGESGNDELIGEWGNDTLTGGAGADFFSGGDGLDRYTDRTAIDWYYAWDLPERR
jgi:Ca2+-binding RTX toxin-like protein